ncbi:hypothetical protein FHG87_016554 [Trinorchestia longiramus]|nr:hypothetical protein FHG87_016554 [Trinorchestia longiramus]
MSGFGLKVGEEILSCLLDADDIVILAMKAESIRKREIGSSILDMDDLIQAGCFLEDGVHLSQEGETKLSQRFIRWIRATHLLMEGRMD